MATVVITICIKRDRPAVLNRSREPGIQQDAGFFLAVGCRQEITWIDLFTWHHGRC